MPFRVFRNREQQAATETNLPERFDDGSAWRALAERASALGDVREFSTEEWQALTGIATDVLRGPLIASSMWTLSRDYEAARLEAKFITLTGLDELLAQRAQFARELRGALNPTTIRGLRGALFISAQADTDPDRRRPWSRLVRDLDLQTATLFRARAPATPRPPPRFRTVRAPTPARTAPPPRPPAPPREWRPTTNFSGCVTNMPDSDTALFAQMVEKWNLRLTGIGRQNCWRVIRQGFGFRLLR